MAKLILTQGIPASRKTTYAKAWVKEDPKTRSRANRDDLRLHIYGEYVLDSEREKIITKVQQAHVEELLKSGISVIVDDTNLNSKFIKVWMSIANKLGVEIEMIGFPVTLEEALSNNRKRHQDGGNFVNENVIKNFYTRYTKNGILPGMPKQSSLPKTPATFTPGLSEAVLVDIDGTLARMVPGGRSPFDWARVGEDLLIPDVANIVRFLQSSGKTIIFMSGRDEVCRDTTSQWLQDHEFKVDLLFMRPMNDYRPDFDVKYELYDKHVRGKYNVTMVFDDRNSVVSMWRSIGLTVAQVAEGDF